ncbi:MAG: hypothetical protein ACLFUI_04560 [Halanaerobiales bacterium]
MLIGGDTILNEEKVVGDFQLTGSGTIEEDELIYNVKAEYPTADINFNYTIKATEQAYERYEGNKLDLLKELKGKAFKGTIVKINNRIYNDASYTYDSIEKLDSFLE